VLAGIETVLKMVVYARLVIVEPTSDLVITDVDKIVETTVVAAALSVIKSVVVANEVLRTVKVTALGVVAGEMVMVLVTLVY
jgi:hypothetical protein